MNYFTRTGDEEREFRFERRDGRLYAHSGERVWMVDLSMIGDGRAFSLLVDGHSHDVLLDTDAKGVVVQVHGERLVVEVEDERERAAHQVSHAQVGGRREVRAVMPGVVVEVATGVGQQVEEGQAVLILEAMKMQNPVPAESAGVVAELKVAKGDTVAAGDVLCVIESD